MWNEGRAVEIIDSRPTAEVLRCIQVGLLCVQDNASDRPDMSLVVFMLSNEFLIPSPKQPSHVHHWKSWSCEWNRPIFLKWDNCKDVNWACRLGPPEKSSSQRGSVQSSSQALFWGSGLSPSWLVWVSGSGSSSGLLKKQQNEEKKKKAACATLFFYGNTNANIIKKRGREKNWAGSGSSSAC